MSVKDHKKPRSEIEKTGKRKTEGRRIEGSVTNERAKKEPQVGG